MACGWLVQQPATQPPKHPSNQIRSLMSAPTETPRSQVRSPEELEEGEIEPSPPTAQVQKPIKWQVEDTPTPPPPSTVKSPCYGYPKTPKEEGEITPPKILPPIQYNTYNLTPMRQK